MAGSSEPQRGLRKAIEDLRQSRQMSPAELAARSGLDIQELYEIERGILEPTWGDMRRVAKALDVPFPEFCALAERLDSELTSQNPPKPPKDLY